MTQKNTPAGTDKKPESQPRGKKPYMKPDFRFEKVFETLALTCGKLQHEGGLCRSIRKRS